MRTEEEIFKDINCDESKIAPYTLPSQLETKDGRTIDTAFEWMVSQRPYLIRLFQENMYGKIPPRPDSLSFETLTCDDSALNGKAIRKEIRIHCGNADKNHSFDMLLYIPKDVDFPVPAFLGLNFKGNYTCTDDADVTITPAPSVGTDTTNAYSSDAERNAARGIQKDRWCFEKLISHGYASATIYYDDIFPDAPEGFEHSIYKLFHTKSEMENTEKDFGAISAWAWGLSRAFDCLESEKLVDSNRIILHGHSRLGKTALWAGACDQRFSAVISNDSGCCGAAISNRVFGENLEWILYWRTYWFNTSMLSFVDNEKSLPFDQHALISLIAPRPVYVASASDDHHADPKGEFLSLYNAGPVYRLFGCAPLESDIMPQPDTPIGAQTAYHLRTGKHDITSYDWDQFITFADKHLKKQ